MSLYAFAPEGSITKYPYGFGDLKKEHPTTSFPTSFAEFDFSSYGVVAVETAEPPAYDFKTHRIKEGSPALIDGSWRQAWSLEELSAEERQQIEANQASSVRTERNQRLADSDWTQLPDAPVNAQEWASYRQVLRDITEQAGFPWEISWPEPPAQ